MELSDSVYVALNLAEAYTAPKRYEDAENVLTFAISRKPDSGDAYYRLAIAYLDQGRLQEAEAAALQADSRPHRIADLHLVLAKMYLHKNLDKLVEQLELYLKEAPNGAEKRSCAASPQSCKTEIAVTRMPSVRDGKISKMCHAWSQLDRF